MAKKVAIIFGGPKKESNTHLLVKEAQRGLADTGVESEIIFLNDLSIKGCQDCGYCKVQDAIGCAIKDDMQLVRRAMEQADAILVATPVYYGSVTAQTKLWQDRLYAYVKPGRSLLGPKKIGFIFTQNNPDEKLFLSSLQIFMGLMKMVGLEQAGHLVVPNLLKGVKPMVTENALYMSRAYDLGKNLI